MRFIDEVCGMFDVEVLCDIEEVEHDPLGVDWTGLREPELRVTPVIALGCRAEMAAGLVGFVMTPWFHDEAKLEGFLGYHIDRLRELAEEEEPAPNMIGWPQWSIG